VDIVRVEHELSSVIRIEQYERVAARGECGPARTDWRLGSLDALIADIVPRTGVKVDVDRTVRLV
jgi:hypothetical protein